MSEKPEPWYKGKLREQAMRDRIAALETLQRDVERAMKMFNERRVRIERSFERWTDDE